MVDEAAELLLDSCRDNARKDAPSNAIWECRTIDVLVA